MTVFDHDADDTTDLVAAAGSAIAFWDNPLDDLGWYETCQASQTEVHHE